MDAILPRASLSPQGFHGSRGPDEQRENQVFGQRAIRRQHPGPGCRATRVSPLQCLQHGVQTQQRLPLLGSIPDERAAAHEFAIVVDGRAPANRKPSAARSASPRGLRPGRPASTGFGCRSARGRRRRGGRRAGACQKPSCYHDGDDTMPSDSCLGGVDWFHDTAFGCVAQSYKVEQCRESMADLLARACGRHLP